jgi:hypothetical protein
MGWIQQHLDLVDRQSDQASHVDQPRATKAILEEEIASHRSAVTIADENITALENRMVDYLTRLHVPQLGEPLTVK